MAPHEGLERRVLAALDANPSRIAVVLGGCGSGRTTMLHALADRLGPHRQCQYIDVERSASTPERFCRAVASHDALPHHRAGERSHLGARGVRSHAAPADPHRRRLAVHVPAGRDPRAADLRELPGPAPRAARDDGRAGGERQPIRADQPLRRARPPAAARHRRPLRGHSPAVAVARRGHRHAAADGRHAGGGSRVRGPHHPGPDRRPRRLRPRHGRCARPR